MLFQYGRHKRRLIYSVKYYHSKQTHILENQAKYYGRHKRRLTYSVKDHHSKQTNLLENESKHYGRQQRRLIYFSKISPVTLSSKETHIAENKSRIYCTPNSKCTDPALPWPKHFTTHRWRLTVMLLCRFCKKFLANVRNDTSTGNGIFDQIIKFFVSSNSNPQMLRLTFRSLVVVTASSKTPAVIYSRTLAQYTAAVAPTLPFADNWDFNRRWIRPTGNYNKSKQFSLNIAGMLWSSCSKGYLNYYKA